MEKKIKVQELLGSITKNLECSICLDLLNNPVSTKCDHPFCRFCILEFLEKKRSVPCPLCKAPITKRSLNERPLLNNMVEGVRKMILSFQEDTGAIFSPPRGPQVMNLTPCTPESVPSKSVRGTKRKIISESPKRTNLKTNCRQSKRKKSLQDTLGESDNALPQTVSTPETDNQTALLNYLDQGSCGGNDNSGTSSCQNQENTSANYMYRNKNNSESRENKSNCDMKVGRTKSESITNCLGDKKVKSIDNKKSSLFDLTTKEKLGQKFYSLRDHQKVEYILESSQSCSDSPEKADLYNFNDSPVKPVHMLRHRRKYSVKDKTDAGDLSVFPISTDIKNKFSDEEVHGKNKISLNINHDHKNSHNLLQRGHKKQTIEGQDVSVSDKTHVKDTMTNSATSDNVRKNKETKQNLETDNYGCSPDFELKEKGLFEVNCKTYTRQKNKHSHIKLYNKVNSWLKESVVNQNEGNHDDVQEEEICIKGDNSVIDNSQVGLNTNENVIELDGESDHENESSQLEDKCETVVESEVEQNVEMENKENDKQTVHENKNVKRQNSIVQKLPNKMTSNDIANSNDDQLEPIVGQKRRIFRTKPKLQTTSVCQKKGVLIIKKVSPGGNTEEEAIDKGENKVVGQEIDPFEFKSSQKTPVIPDTKRNKTFKKGSKDKVKGKLDLKFGKVGKSSKSEVIEISEDSSDSRKDKIIDKRDGIKKTSCILNEFENVGNDHVHSDCIELNSNENSKKLDKTTAKSVPSQISGLSDVQTRVSLLLKDVSPKISGSFDSQTSLIPGSIDESVSGIGKQNKKLTKLSNKLKKKKVEEIDKEKSMEKMIEKINSAEDFDLLTCTQEVIEDMDKNTASSDVIPDTADVSNIPKRKKSVSFASNNVEISGTPRQTRRSVPMLEDRNRGKLLPKEVKQGSKLADKSSATIGNNKTNDGKPFVWEEDGHDSNGSSDTDDLDIHPSQEEFEIPSEDATFKNHADKSFNTSSQNIDGIKLTQSCDQSAVMNESHMIQNVQPRKQGKHSKASDKEERQSKEMSQLQESLTQADDKVGYIDDSNVYVDNTQEDIISHEQDREEEENMEVQVVPESVDDLLVEDDKVDQESVDGMLAEDNTNKTNQESVDLMLVEDNTRKENQKSVEVMLDNTNKKSWESVGDNLIKDSLCETQEEILTGKNKDNSAFGQVQTEISKEIGEREITQNVKEVHSESQSTVSTINSSLDSNNSIRKSRKKLRMTKFKSPERAETPSVVQETPLIVGKESEENTHIEISSVVEETPIIVGKDLEEKNIEIVSDTCSMSTSQESVSILIPVENLSMNKGERLKQRRDGERGKTLVGKAMEESVSNSMAETEIDLEPIVENLSNKTEILPCNVKKKDEFCYALTNSNSEIADRDVNVKPELESNTGEKNNYDKNLKKTHEICDESDMSDVVYVSQYNKKINEPIVLSGNESDQKEETINTVADTADSEMETVSETMETDEGTEGEGRETVICSQRSIEPGLTPTLVSQKTLHLRNSAEKKRLSAERQLHDGKANENDGRKIPIEKQEVKNSTCSPEDIFQMDSELMSNESQSFPQNQEGIIGFDLESQEMTNTLKPSEVTSQNTIQPSEVVSQNMLKQSEVAGQNSSQVSIQNTFQPSVVESQNNFKPSEVSSQKSLKSLEPVDLNDKKCLGDERMETEVGLYPKLSKKNVNSPKTVDLKEQGPDSDIDSSPEKSVKRKNTGRRTVRGLARKKHNLNSQNSKSTDDSCLNDDSEINEIENTESKLVSPYKSIAYNQKEVKSPYNSVPKTNIDVTPRKSPENMESNLVSLDKNTAYNAKEVRSPYNSVPKTSIDVTPRKSQEKTTKKNHLESKISPTFAYSPQKPKKARKIELKKKKLTSRSILNTGSSDHKSGDIETSCQVDSDSDFVMTTENKFEKLLKDDIADAEVSDDERETIREDTLNFSVDLTLMDEIEDEKNSSENKNKKNENNIMSNEQNKRTQSQPDNGNDHEGQQIFTTVLGDKGDNKSEHDTIKKKTSPKQESLKVLPNQDGDDSDSDVNMEASSPLPDMIGDRSNFNQRNILNESEDDDAVLIKYDQEGYDTDCGEKRLDDLNTCEKPTSPNKNRTVTTMDKKEDFDEVHDFDDEVQELDDKVQDLDENSDDEVVTVKKKRRRIIEEDSDSSGESEDSSSGRHLDNTSSSAFSSQSEPVDTQQKNKLESEIERMRREMKELQAKLAAAKTENNSSISQTKKTKDPENGPVTVLNLSDADEQEKKPDSPSSEDIHEYRSDEELFLDPPSPPPLSPQRIDLSNDGNDFMTEFRKQNLELSPLHSSPCEKNKEIVINEDVRHEELKTLVTTKNYQKNNTEVSSRTDCQDELIEHSQAKSRRVPQSKDNKPTLVYSPVIKGDNSPQISPLIKGGNSSQISPMMGKRGKHVLSPLVSNKTGTQKLQKCFVSTGLVVPQMKELQKLAVLNQCKFIAKFTSEVTHVIVKTDPIGSGICDRTLKFFQGISHKCWILDYKWVIDSRTAGHLLPESEYEIKGDTVTDELHYGPRRARLSKSTPLFNNIQFLVLGNSKGLQVDDLKSLLKACGGHVMSQIQDITDTDDAVVVTCSDYDDDSEQEDQPAPDELQKFKEFYDVQGILSISREWVLDSLTVYKLQPLIDYILTPGNVRKSSIPLFDKR